jgi:hypothetical protein
MVRYTIDRSVPNEQVRVRRELCELLCAFALEQEVLIVHRDVCFDSRHISRLSPVGLPLHSFYHVYADGDWRTPVIEHFDALTRTGLLKKLTSLHVGFVGSPANVKAVRDVLDGYDYECCAEAETGWEQVTLRPLWEFTQDHEGLVSYAHTKGAANFNPINDPWRRSMEWYCFVNWGRPVDALHEGKYIAGCHWICGGPSPIRGFGTGGMFGGNYWWTRCDLLRQNTPPGMQSRYAAEHWLGQLSQIMPLVPATIYDMNPTTITPSTLHSVWE